MRRRLKGLNDAAKSTLDGELRTAIAEAIEKGDDFEVKRISTFLTAERTKNSTGERDEAGTLKLEIAELKMELESLPSGFVQAMSDVAPGFVIFSDVDGGLTPVHGVLASFAGKKNVLITHPFERTKPAMLKRSFFPSQDDKPVLRFSVSHHHDGDWRLVVTANTEVVYDQNINRKTTKNGWHKVSIDLCAFSGREVELQLNNVATGWRFEQAFWHKVEIVSSTD